MTCDAACRVGVSLFHFFFHPFAVWSPPTPKLVTTTCQPSPQATRGWHHFELFLRGPIVIAQGFVAILFIVFDLEVAFLFPWAVVLGDIGVFGFWSMMLFLAILTVGFIYEWRKGALEWE